MARKKVVPQQFVYSGSPTPSYLDSSDVASSIEEAGQLANDNGNIYEGQSVTVFRLVPVATVTRPEQPEFSITLL